MYRITRFQVRAARALLDWSMLDLARAAHVSVSTIMGFERGDRSVTYVAIALIQDAAERAGVRFLPDDGEGPGVVLQRR